MHKSRFVVMAAILAVGSLVSSNLWAQAGVPANSCALSTSEFFGHGEVFDTQFFKFMSTRGVHFRATGARTRLTLNREGPSYGAAQSRDTRTYYRGIATHASINTCNLSRPANESGGRNSAVLELDLTEGLYTLRAEDGELAVFKDYDRGEVFVGRLSCIERMRQLGSPLVERRTIITNDSLELGFRSEGQQHR